MKYILSPLLILLLLIFGSCNSDFNINAPYKDSYTFNCILQGDTDIQYAVISKSVYSENGSPPVSESPMKNIQGAEIKIFYNDSVFVMRDTTILVNETKVDCYYTKNLQPASGKTVNVEASIPGGNILKSSIKIPELIFGQYTNTLPQLVLMGEKQSSFFFYKEIQTYNWECVPGNKKTTYFMSCPEIEIYYKKYEDGAYIQKKIFLPVARKNGFDEMGNLIPINQKFSLEKNCITTLDAISKTMWQISGDDPNKHNYIITKVILKVRVMDEILSRYYYANNVFSDNFSVKIRPTDVTNIEGGTGIFGAYDVFTRSIDADKYFIQSFGYKYNPK